MARQDDTVPRPTKRSEYAIRYASAGAKKGWSNLAATIRGPLADTWDFLTRTPTQETSTNYALRGDLA